MTTEPLCRLREIDLAGITLLLKELKDLQVVARRERDASGATSYTAGFWTGVAKQSESVEGTLTEIRRNLAAYIEEEGVQE